MWFILFCIKCTPFFKQQVIFPVFWFLLLSRRADAGNHGPQWRNSQISFTCMKDGWISDIVHPFLAGIWSAPPSRETDIHIQAEQVWFCSAGICNPVLSHSVIILSSLCHTLHKQFHSAVHEQTMHITYTHTQIYINRAAPSRNTLCELRFE